MPDPVILLVDDDEDFLTVARRALGRAEIRAQLRVARDGGEGLRILGLSDAEVDTDAPEAEPGPREEAPDGTFRPAVILLDLSMPVRNGWDVLQRIRQTRATREIPVVIVSSSDRPDDVRKSYELGANSFVVKRFESENPGGYLVDAARYWLELNEPPPGPREPQMI